MSRLIDMTGQTFGRLTVVGRGPDYIRPGDGMREPRWECLCVCGGRKCCARSNLLRGLTQSCGCLHSEVTSARHTTHGATVGGMKTVEFTTWVSMIQRCYDPSATSYGRYGARGITVCERWRSSFANFLSDMGQRPTPKHSIERSNNAGNYDPGNCRWATTIEQGRNTRRNRLITFCGETLCMSAWAERTGIPYSAIARRLSLGWPAEKTLTHKLRHQILK